MGSPQKSGQNIELRRVELEIRDDALIFVFDWGTKQKCFSLTDCTMIGTRKILFTPQWEP